MPVPESKEIKITTTEAEKKIEEKESASDDKSEVSINKSEEVSEILAQKVDLKIKKPSEAQILKEEKTEKVLPTRGAPNFMNFMKSKNIPTSAEEKKEELEVKEEIEGEKKVEVVPANQESNTAPKIERKFIKHHNRFKN
jgi:hypothetical protein